MGQPVTWTNEDAAPHTVTVTSGGGTTEPGPSGTLPATGSDSSTGMFVWLGLMFLFTGGAALYLLRRRRA